MKGIDVSSYQGNVDWNKVKRNGIEFAILKVIRKDGSPDKQFENNYKGASDAGIIIQGVYNYSYATTIEKAKMDAKKVVSILGERKPFVWLDVEDNCQKNLGQNLIDIILSYQKIIKANNMDFGVYTGLSFYNTYIKPYYSQIKDIPFWIARYYKGYSSFKVSDSVNAIYKPSIKNKMYGWQYTSSGIVNGINGACDVNIWYQNIEKKDDKELTNQTILRYGDSGENVKMMQQRLLAKNFKTCIIDGQKKKLVADGKFGPITKSILVRFKIYSGLSDEPICDAATWRNLF